MQTQQAGSSVVVPQPSEGRLPVVGRRRRRRIRKEAQWRIHLEKGTGLIADQQYRAALVELSQAVAESPDDHLAECYAIRSQAYLYNADYDRAIDDCNLSIELDPIQADIFACRGSALAHQKQWRQALDDFFTAIRFRPDADETYRPVLLEHIDSAMAEFEELIRTDQADGHLYQTRGMARAYRGEHRQAGRDFAADPDRPHLYARRLHPHWQDGDLSDRESGRRVGQPVDQLGRGNRAARPDEKRLEQNLQRRGRAGPVQGVAFQLA